jgi:hypothetical protein
MTAYDYRGIIALPDGRRVVGHLEGYVEYSTDRWETTDLYLAWEDGTPLTEEEENEEIAGAYLHEWVEDRLLLLPPELVGSE